MNSSRPQPNALNGQAETPLHGAAWVGDLSLVRALVESGGNVNHIDSAGEYLPFMVLQPAAMLR